MIDGFGRDIFYLRLSVTDLVQSPMRVLYAGRKACAEAAATARYCLTIEEIEQVVRASAQCGIRKVRITGGEPLVRRGIIDICRRISAIPGS